MKIKEYTLRNNKLEATFINLGASITKLIDIESGINIIIGHDDLNKYKINPGYMNSIIGRHAGRILDFKLDNKFYEISKNSGLCQLHGGYKGLNLKYFDVDVLDNQITFSTKSYHLEEGFPGLVNFSITYKLVDDELQLLYEAVSSQKTLMSFTNHAYFNLSGNIENTILNHELYIDADYFIALNRNMIPIKRASLDHTPLDFRNIKRIGRDINIQHEQLSISGGYDHPYLINKKGYINHVATLKSPETNLTLEVFSDQDVVVLYTGNSIDESSTLNNGVSGDKHYALCLETHGIPNSININEFQNRNVYEANETYKQTTIWKLHR